MSFFKKIFNKNKTEALPIWFLSIASHQLLTPASIIKGYIELIQDGAYGKISEELRHVLGDMYESNERLINLTDEFLDISRIEEGWIKFNFEMKDINKLIDSVVSELAKRTRRKGLELKWEMPAEAFAVYMDEEKIRHVVFNFIDNAIKYTKAGTVEVEISKVKNGLSFRIMDSGLGFNKGDEANFFQKFYRGQNVKSIDSTGTGLGLYICRQFIEGHGGRVWAKSRGLGQGGEFGFYLPLNQDKLNQTVQEKSDKINI